MTSPTAERHRDICTISVMAHDCDHIMTVTYNTSKCIGHAHDHSTLQLVFNDYQISAGSYKLLEHKHATNSHHTDQSLLVRPQCSFCHWLMHYPLVTCWIDLSKFSYNLSPKIISKFLSHDSKHLFHAKTKTGKLKYIYLILQQRVPSKSSNISQKDASGLLHFWSFMYSILKIWQLLFYSLTTISCSSFVE